MVSSSRSVFDYYFRYDQATLQRALGKVSCWSTTYQRSTGNCANRFSIARISPVHVLHDPVVIHLLDKLINRRRRKKANRTSRYTHWNTYTTNHDSVPKIARMRILVVQSLCLNARYP